MSKIVTKKQLDLVMENTIKEADYMMENKSELNLSKSQMDELHKEGHCMCDDKCVVYTEDIKGDDKKMSELLQKLASEQMDCVIVSKEQMDMLHKDGKCDCDNNVTLSYEDEMKEGDYMNHMEDGMKAEGDYMEDGMKAEGDDSHDDSMNEEQMCNECGGTMVEGVCEGCSGMSEAGVDEGNEFTGALAKAKEEGENTFKVDGKTYTVTEVKEEEVEEEVESTSVEESVNGLTEALSKTTNKEIIKEDMDFFNKMVNYKK